MLRTFYAIITPDDGAYTIQFANYPGIISEAKTFEDIIPMAQDALGQYFYDEVANKEALPESDKDYPQNVEVGSFVTLINCDLEGYYMEQDSKPVIRSVSLPRGLAEKAKANNISLSETLQDALRKRL